MMRAGWFGLIALARAAGMLAIVLFCQPASADERILPADLGDAAKAFAPTPVDDDACMQALRCCCCPSWTKYAIFDVLFLQACPNAGDRPLVFDDAGTPLMTTKDLTPAVASGVRLFYGSLVTDTWGWEIGYTGVYGMFGSAGVTGAENLSLPPDLGQAVNNFNNADAVRATSWASLNMAEFNVFCYDCCQECGPTHCPLTNCRPNCHCVRFLTGFLWAGLDQQASLTAECCDPPEPSTYAVRTSTNYFGPQVGMWGRREWCRWAAEGWWKAAVCGTSAYQAQDPIAGSISGPERPALSSQTGGVGFIGGLNGTIIYRLTDVWGLRAGYNVYWLTNAAMAPTQWDFSTATTAGTGINDNGGLFLHGANLGVEARW